MAERLYARGIDDPTQRREYVRDLARNAADTGNFADFYDLERYLSRRGFTKARHILDQHELRIELTERWAAAIKKRGRAAEKAGIPYNEPATPLSLIDPMGNVSGGVRNPILRRESETGNDTDSK